MKIKIINWLIKKILRMEYVSIQDTKRLAVYLRLKDSDVLALFKAKYTDHYVAHLLASTDEERWMMKGRILEMLDWINSIECVEETMAEADKYHERFEQKEQALKMFKDNLVSKIPFIQQGKSK